MRFDDRTYPDVVRDLLTLLTGGTVQETHDVPEEGLPLVHLRQTPVRRVSHLEGEIALGDERTRYRFSERDFELIGRDDNPSELVALRFRDRGKKPAGGSQLTVNYYPLRQKPTPINDVNVGSVARTLLETLAREIATQYAQLQKVYDSAFVETAEGSSLDKVVALVAVRRIERGHPIGKVRFSRRQGAAGSIFIPAHSAVTDGAGNRYLTSSDASLLPNQGHVEVWVHGETRRMKPLAAQTLNVLERALAGVDRVVNDEPTYAATDAETDEQLRQRARRAIHGTGKGTLDAIRFGLESLPFVSGVTLSEYTGLPDSPVSRPGVLRIDVALREDNAYNRSLVDARITELRAAGIYIERHWAAGTVIAFSADLRLAGASAPASTIAEIQDGITNRLRDLVQQLAPGSTLRRARVLSLVLADERVVDVTLTTLIDGQPLAADSFGLPADKSGKPADDGFVRFGAVVFDAATPNAQAGLVSVDVDLGVTDLALTTPEIEGLLKPKLELLLAGVSAGAALSFEQVATAVRDTESDARYVLVPNTSLLVLEREGGAFSELRVGGSFSVPANTGLVLRRLTVREATP